MVDRVSDLQERFLALVQREMGADTVVIDTDGSPPRGHELRADLGDGRVLVCRFDAPIEGENARTRRLFMLVSSFTELTTEPVSERVPRPPVARSLHDELRILSQRSRATDALVIDATSPIVWGAASREFLKHHQPDDDSGYLPAEADTEGLPELSLAALAEVRILPNLPSLHRGRQLRYQSQSDDCGLVAHSFGGIYVLVLVYDGVFDELRAERSLADAVPRIQRLVAALPPLEPTPAPQAGVVAFRSRKRR